MKNFFPLFSVVILLLGGCSTGPKPIEYGSDPCEYCRMTIVDKQHAAEAVTSKGKVYKFDAIECMVNFLLTGEKMEFAHLVVNPYTRPGELLDAAKSTFLISKNIPSPMGAFLSAFADEGEARKMQQEKGGTIYDWTQLQAYFKEVGPHYFLNNR